MSPVTPLINSKYGAEFISLSGAIGDFDLVYERWERALGWVRTRGMDGILGRIWDESWST